MLTGLIGGMGSLPPARAEQDFQTRQWTTQHGLPDDSVQTMHQGRNGCLWVGTARGLVRFDGARFTVWDRNNTPALRVDDIRLLAEDGDGDLWIGTAAGLVRKRGGEFNRWVTEDGREAYGGVLSLLSAKDGSVWLISRAGLLRWKAGRFHLVGGPEHWRDGGIAALCEDAAGTLWAGARRGLVRLGADGLLEDL
ncbi:MAG TPA: two-component regulator propeller domain-containing protein, partial [Methylomirabilota bacterium]|nr:two-component regulator propeller domain-containing protein [Methylomirabilota bacterium]